MSLLLLLSPKQPRRGLTLPLLYGVPKLGTPVVASIVAPTPIPDPVVIEDDDALSASISGLRIPGVTLDSTGAVDPFCAVYLFETATNLFVRATVSDAAGAYSFGVAAGKQYFVVSYKSGMVTPDVAGTTLNTLTGV